MKSKEFDALLRETFADQRLSRSEKQLFKQILEEEAPNEHTLAVYRQRAFATARDALISPEAKRVLDWLEEVVKALRNKEDKSKSSPIYEAWFSPKQDCPKKIAGMIQAARQSLDVCVFTITDNRLSRPILDAHSRGVNVRIMTDDEKLFDAGSDIREFHQAGIAVRTDRTEYHMHHKFAIFDNDLLLTGSYNWTRSAANSNEENFIVTNNAKLLSEFRMTFEETWADGISFKE